jgi:5-formyltetrahydrofolate cyclo-ligase
MSELQTGSHGISQRLREPVAGEEVPLSHIDCLIVPGLAFTKAGARLGRGGGYYDRVLASIDSNTVTVGVCFEFQVLEALPVESHDLSVQRVLWA